MDAISLFPHFIPFGALELSQTLLTSLFSTVLFIVFILLYQLLRKVSPANIFVHAVEYIIESMTEFFAEIGEHLSMNVITIVLFLFFYILRINLIGLIGDRFVLVIPSLHDYFRPVGTDIYFNFLLAGICVIGSIVYGFITNGFHYIEKYIPYKGMGIVEGNKRYHIVLKPLDILVGLFIGLIELIGEVAKVLSLSLRLFGNILAGMVLMGMIIAASINIFHIPLIMPLLVFIMELLVSIIQAFVFSMLVLVYFRMAGEGHH